MDNDHFPPLLPNLATIQMLLNNPIKSLMRFFHRHLVNIPNRQFLLPLLVCKRAQYSARVCLYAQRGQAKSWTSELLRSLNQSSVPSIRYENTESPATCLLLSSLKCPLVYSMDRKTKALGIFLSTPATSPSTSSLAL